MIAAEIVKDSKNELGDRLTTFKLTMPRIVLAEFNTHRMISRNSASSRAIPFETMLKRVSETPFKPLRWQLDHKGMQGNEYADEVLSEILDTQWLGAKDEAILNAKALSLANATKQICNRLLEPFMYHTVIATATEWENFFALRAHPAAEIHIQDLAYRMLEEYNKSTPQQLSVGQWHIPFEEIIDIDEVQDYLISNNWKGDSTSFLRETDKLMAKVSAGICAGISYGRVKDKIDIVDILDLYDSLVTRPYEGKRGIRTLEDPIHASPTEHQAKAMNFSEYSGNFKGFAQFRKMLDNENATDKRVVKK